jgi:hypothetical protein
MQRIESDRSGAVFRLPASTRRCSTGARPHASLTELHRVDEQAVCDLIERFVRRIAGYMSVFAAVGTFPGDEGGRLPRSGGLPRTWLCTGHSMTNCFISDSGAGPTITPGSGFPIARSAWG